ncbi:MAG: hypothetical protein RLZZ601_668 [Pseudomonadota bacterium]
MNIRSPYCAICNTQISAGNNSKEHVITEAIGGRLRVSGFICKSCNNEAGRTWDAKLASQLLPLAHIFGVTRQRGVTPGLPISTTTGENLIMRPDGGFSPNKPSFSEEITPDGVQIKIVARDVNEAKSMLKGVQRKYPNTNTDQLLANAEFSSSYPTGMVHHQLDFGGEVSGRSIVKSVLALAHQAGIAANLCNDAIQYLRDHTAPACFGYYQATDLVANRPLETPLHCVAVNANPVTGLVLGYAEYFGIHRVVVCLGKGYCGEVVKSSYAIDPRTGKELYLSVNLDFNESEIDAIYRYEMIPNGAIEAAFHAVMPAALKKKDDFERERVIAEATEYAFKNCGAKYGEILTESQVKKLSSLLLEKLTPYIMHMHKSNKLR